MTALFPYREFQFETRLSPEEVGARLAAAVEPARWFFQFREPRRPFEGAVGSGEFRITRVIGYRNAFLPVVSGRVVATAGGSRVEGTMELHPAVEVFMTLWLGGVLLGCFATGCFAAREALAGRSPKPALAVPFGMFAFGWGVTAFGFGFEVRKALRLLQQIVGAEPARPDGAI